MHRLNGVYHHKAGLLLLYQCADVVYLCFCRQADTVLRYLQARKARSLICRVDSSPVIYNTLTALLMARKAVKARWTCPRPALRPKGTTLPKHNAAAQHTVQLTDAGNNTAFSSVALISLKVRELMPRTPLFPFRRKLQRGFSFAHYFLRHRVSRPAGGQRPIQRGDVSPQLLQTYIWF